MTYEKLCNDISDGINRMEMSGITPTHITVSPATYSVLKKGYESLLGKSVKEARIFGLKVEVDDCIPNQMFFWIRRKEEAEDDRD